MTIAVWIVSGLLTLLYLYAGSSKALLSSEKLAKNFPWTESVGVRNSRVVGALEVIAAVGLILPALTGILPILSAFASVGLVLVQVGAIITHVRRGEFKALPMNVVLLLLAAFVAVARFLGY